MPADHGGQGSGAWPAPPPGSAAAPPPPVRYAPPPMASGAYPWLPGDAPGPGGRGVPQLGAAHKPGAIPLRPLRLGDMYDGAFKIIRRNPGATVGSATLVTAVALAIPVLVFAVLTQLLDLTVLSDSTLGTTGTTAEDPITTGELTGLLVALGSFVLGLSLQAVGTVLVTGMVTHVTLAAALGRRLTLAQAWAATRGKRWRLIGLITLLVLASLLAVLVLALTWVPVVLVDQIWLTVVYALVSLVLAIAGSLLFWVRVQYYAVPALMLEPVGILGAVRRSLLLSRRQFWRTFGIALLTILITSVAGSMLSTPVSLVGQLLTFLADSPEVAVLISLVVFAASSTIQYAFTTPFTSTVSALQYLDQRMRKEAYDVELVARTGGLLP